jgi:hypothetical protein
MSIYGNAVGGITGYGKTFILQDENGNELTGVVVDEETIFTATDNDVREGMVYASDSGVSTGSKVIPSYNTTEGKKIITSGSKCVIPIPDYDYTRLQAIICSYNTNIDDSVASEKVVINDNVYDVQSTVSTSLVTKDDNNARIDLGITNTSGDLYIIRYFTYKEIY